MPTDDDFLQAITSDPDADAPRLAYADWLEETGDAPRAELIRVQCALAALPEGEREFHPLRQREEELLEQHRDEWLQPLRELLRPVAARPAGWLGWLRRPAPPGLGSPRFCRGFVESAAADPVAFLRHGATLMCRTPLRKLVLDVRSTADGTGTLRALTECPHLRPLRSLTLSTHCLSADEMRRLVGCPHLAGLTGLRLWCEAVDRAAAEVLAGSGLLGRLESLEVLGVRANPTPWADAVLEAPAARGLTALSVHALEGDTGLLRRLSGSPPFPRLAELSLAQLAVGDRSLREFLDWLPPSLTGLDLWGMGLGDRAATSLARWPRLGQFRVLALKCNRVSDPGALALADSPHLFASTRLDLSINPISERVRDALRVRLGHHVTV